MGRILLTTESHGGSAILCDSVYTLSAIGGPNSIVRVPDHRCRVELSPAALNNYKVLLSAVGDNTPSGVGVRNVLVSVPEDRCRVELSPAAININQPSVITPNGNDSIMH